MNQRLERVLLAVLLAVMIGLSALHGTSDTASRIRNGSRVCAWLILKEPGRPIASAENHLLVYSWDKRMLTILHTDSAQEDLSDLGLDPPFSAVAELPSVFGKPDSPEAVKRWIDSWPRNARFWLNLPKAAVRLRRHTEPTPSFYDLILLSLELYRLKPWLIRLASIPASPLDRGKLAALLDTSSGAAQNGVSRAEGADPVTVQVLNASGENGIALQATKVLRWQKADVLEFAGTPSSVEKTQIIDHTGDYKTAEKIRRALGCGMDVEVLSRIDLHSRAAVTASLGKDYRQCRALAEKQPLY